MRRILFSLMFVACLSGCATGFGYKVQGPPQVLNARGAGIVPPTNPTIASLQKNFYESAEAASKPGSTDVQVKQFLRSGFALAYANCNDYFWSMGKFQTRSRMFGEAITPFANFGTGIIGLTDFAKDPEQSQRWVSALSLLSAVASATNDVSNRNVLFGVDNIDPVRELTHRALQAHAKAAVETPPTEFEEAAILIIENQAICTPQHILTLARSAISTASVTTTTSPTAKAISVRVNGQ
jgi:hypothetical protein